MLPMTCRHRVTVCSSQEWQMCYLIKGIESLAIDWLEKIKEGNFILTPIHTFGG